MELRLFLFLLVWLVGTARTVPTPKDGDSCSTHCSNDVGNFQYEVGKTYVYSVEGTSAIYVDNAVAKRPVTYRLNAEITVKSRCEMYLQITDFRTEYEGQRKNQHPFIEEAMKHSLPFAFNDGRVEHVCPSQEDSVSVINLKKAILSALQNSMTGLRTDTYLREADIMGVCDTKYQTEDFDESKIVIKKWKQLHSCTNRNKGSTAIMADIYESPHSSFQNLPILMDEVYECTQTVKGKIIHSVTCKESSVFRPFTRHENVATMEAEMTLHLVNVKQSSRMDITKVTDRTGLTAAYVPPRKPETKESEVIALIRELCPKIDGVVHKNIASQFPKLVDMLRRMSPHSVEKAYNAIRKGRPCKSPKALDIYLDALPMAGTAGPIRLISKLIEAKTVNKVRENIWLTLLAFTPRPDAEAVNAAVALLQSETVGRQALLGVTSMIYRFCTYTDKCKDIPAVKNAITALQKRLGYKCRVDNPDEEDQIIGVLKAFGNLGIAGDAMDNILECATTGTSTSIPIRLAAIEAFRRMEPVNNVISKLLELYGNMAEDTEIRIASYLALMKWPSKDTIQKIKEIFEKETSRQVGSFTWTHLTNLQETSSPMKQEIKDLLSDIELKKRFSTNWWRYSGNQEWSYFYEHLNVGADLEQNTIFTTDSHFPKAASLNLGVDIFNNHINLLEVGGRLEGLDHILEKIFGPHGYFEKNNPLSDFMLRFGDKLEDDDSQANRVRARRDTSNDYQTKLDLFDERVNAITRNDPQGSTYFKIFGNELAWFRIRNLRDFELSESIDLKSILNEMIRNNRFDATRNFMFLDTTVQIPSITGRTYHLDLRGNGNIGLRAEGTFDVKQLLSSPRNCDIEGRLQPSATLEISANIEIESDPTPGVKLVSTLFTSFDVNGKLEVKDGRIATARLNLPSDKVEIFSFKTDLYEVDATTKDKPAESSEMHNFNHCTRSFTKMFGVEFCGKFNLHRPAITSERPYIPITGPIDIEFSIKKTDLSDKGFELIAELPDETASVHKTYKLSFDTPDSRLSRKHAVQLHTSNGDLKKAIKLELQCMAKSIEANAFYQIQDSSVRGKFELLVDKEQKFCIDVDTQYEKRRNIEEMRPTLQIKCHDQEPFILSGYVRRKLAQTGIESDEITMDLSTNKPVNKPIRIRGSAIREGLIKFDDDAMWSVLSDYNVTLPTIDIRMHRSISKQGKIYSTESNIEYQVQGYSQHTIKMTGKTQDLSTEHLKKVTSVVALYLSQYPESNLQINWDMQWKRNEHMENDISLRYGEDLQNEERVIRVLQVSKLSGGYLINKQASSENKLALNAPEFGIDFAANLNTEWDFTEAPQFQVTAGVRQSAERFVNMEMLYHSKKPVNLAVEAKLEYPSRQIVYRDQLQETAPNEFQGKSFLQWQVGEYVTVEYTYRRMSDDRMLHHEVEAAIELPGLNEPIRHNTVVIIKEDSYLYNSHTKVEGHPAYSTIIKFNHGRLEFLEYKGISIAAKITADQSVSRKWAYDLTFKPGFNTYDMTGVVAYSSEGELPRLTAMMNWKSNSERPLNIEMSSVVKSLPSNSPDGKYHVETKILCPELEVEYEVENQGTNRLAGPHDMKITMKNRTPDPLEIEIHYAVVDRHLTSKLSIQGRQHLVKVDVTGKFILEGGKLDLGGKVSILSPTHRKWGGKTLSYNLVADFVPQSRSFVSDLRVQISPGKMYTNKIDYSRYIGPNSGNIRARALISTPHAEWKSEQVSLSTEYNEHSLNFNVDVSSSTGKKLEVSTSMEVTGYSISFRQYLRTPFASLQSLKVEVMRENRPGKRLSKASLDVNKYNIFSAMSGLDYESSTSFKGVASLESFAVVTMRAHIQAVKEQHTVKYEAGLQRESEDVLLGKATIIKRGRGFTGSVSLDRMGSRLLEMDIVNTVPTFLERKYKIDVRGPFTPYTFNIHSARDGDELRTMLGVCVQNEARCISLESHLKTEPSGDPVLYRELQLTLKKEGKLDITLAFLLQHGTGIFRNKLLLGSLGYDINVDTESDTRKMGLKVFLPSREMEAKARVKTSRHHWGADLQVRSDIQRHPNRKLTFAFEHRGEQDYNEVYEAKTTFSIDHPVFKKPITLDIHTISNPGALPMNFTIKAQLDYSPMPEDKLTAEILFRIKRGVGDDHNETWTYKLYRQDRELDATLKVHDATRGSLYTNGGEWEWKNRFGEMKNGYSKLEANTDTLETNMWCRSVDEILEIHFKDTTPEGSEDMFEAVCDVLMNGQDSKTVMKLDARKSHAVHSEIDVYKPPGTLYKRYEFIGSTTARPLLVLTAHSYDTGEKVTDLAVTLSEWKEQLLDLHVHWNPPFVSLLLMEIMRIPMDLQSDLSEAAQEIQDKYFLVESSFRQWVLDPWQTYRSSEAAKLMDELRQEFKKFKEGLDALSLDLLFEDIINEVVEKVNSALSNIITAIAYFEETLAPEFIKSWVRSTRDWIHTTWYDMCPAGSHCYNVHKAYHGSKWGEVRQELRAMFTSLPQTILTGVQNAIYAAAEKLGETFDKLLDALFDYLDNWIEWLQTSEEIKRWREKISDTYDRVVDKIGEYRYRATRRLEELYREILKNDDVRAIVDFMISVLEEMKTEFSNHRPNILDRLLALVDDDDDEVEKPPPFQPLEFDPEKGDLRAVIHAPKLLQSLRSDSIDDDFFDDDDEENEEEEEDDDEDGYYTALKNNMIQMKRLADHGLRPTEQALLVGGKHFVTFDKKFYDFAGDCTYLLARDFVDKNFTVMIKYRGEDDGHDVSKSIIVILNGRTIEIDPEGKLVLLDGQIVELPIIQHPVTVKRDGNKIVVEDEPNVVVWCHLKYDVCSTTISGWYFGKTAGLFGAYDYEPANDMRRPRGQIAGTVTNFARSWEVGRRNCRSKNLAKDTQLSKNDPYYKKCKKYFDDDESPLSSCFSTVPEEEYFKMCLRHVAAASGKTTPDQALCNVAAAYVADCHQHYMEITMPPMCLTCDSLDGRPLPYGDRQTYSRSIPQSADIVFVVEERQCNQPVIKDIDNIVRVLDRELTTSGYRNNRYGVVGFGGNSDRSESHAHTARGNLFFEVPDVILATEKITFHNGRNGRVNAFGALKFAADYPFRPGVAKVAVLMTCSACKDDHMSISYSVTQQMLLERGIILHVLNDRGIEIKGSATKGRGIVAVDTDTVYRGKDVTQRELEGEPDLRSQVAVPKDVCIALAQEVGGSFFTTSALTDSQYTDVKNWKSLFARRVAKSAEPPQCQTCECVAKEDGSSTLCRPCVTPRPKVPISLYTSEDPEYF